MDPLSPLISALHNQGRLRVWSMVITVFGDLVQHRGGEISTARLGSILGRVGVEPGAIRTALSRLGRDGWVVSRREGRASLYRLSTQGTDRFAPATTRIYAPPRTAPVERWAMALTLGANGRADTRLIPADEAADQGGDCIVTGDLTHVSEAYRRALVSPSHSAALAALAQDLKVLAKADLPLALDAAAARMLLIHRWRRLVLRYPEIDARLMPKDVSLPDPRWSVARAYARLTPGAEQWLADSESTGPQTPLGELLATERFGISQWG